MDESIETGNEVRGRIFAKTVYGDTAGKIEVAALSAAQEFFGDGVPLEVMPDYMARYGSDEPGRKYAAYVKVRAVVQP